MGSVRRQPLLCYSSSTYWTLTDRCPLGVVSCRDNRPPARPLRARTELFKEPLKLMADDDQQARNDEQHKGGIKHRVTTACMFGASVSSDRAWHAAGRGNFSEGDRIDICTNRILKSLRSTGQKNRSHVCCGSDSGTPLRWRRGSSTAKSGHACRPASGQSRARRRLMCIARLYGLLIQSPFNPHRIFIWKTRY
jgi:hypothetical protein